PRLDHRRRRQPHGKCQAGTGPDPDLPDSVYFTAYNSGRAPGGRPGTSRGRYHRQIRGSALGKPGERSAVSGDSVTTFGTIEQAIEDLRNGKIIIVADDEDRENEETSSVPPNWRRPR